MKRPQHTTLHQKGVFDRRCATPNLIELMQDIFIWAVGENTLSYRLSASCDNVLISHCIITVNSYVAIFGYFWRFFMRVEESVHAPPPTPRPARYCLPPSPMCHRTPSEPERRLRFQKLWMLNWIVRFWLQTHVLGGVGLWTSLCCTQTSILCERWWTHCILDEVCLFSVAKSVKPTTPSYIPLRVKLFSKHSFSPV